MKSVGKVFVFLSALALAFFNMPMSAQNQQWPSPDYPFPGYPDQYSPRRTARPRPPDPPAPSSKFIKFQNAVPNQYIVALNDDAVSTAGTADERRARIADLARLMLPVGAEIKTVYGTVLKGFCVKLPNEVAAVALSQDPRVRLVESDGVDGVPTTCQSTTPPGLDPLEGLDRIDQIDLPLDHQYCYNQTGSGVTVYDVGPGVLTTHNQFGSRAFIAYDVVAAHGAADLCTVTSTNNDCDGHGTRMLGEIGGATYGVAKSVTLGSVKIWRRTSSTTIDFPDSYAIEGIDWIATHHNANPTQLEVANCSWQKNPKPLIDDAVRAAVNAGVTFAISSGNNNANLDVSGHTPSEVGHQYALVTGAENQENDSRFRYSPPPPALDQSSDYGSVLALWAPGYNIPSAGIPNNDSTSLGSGTSSASAHTAGVAALYLHGRTGMNGCGSHLLSGPSSSTTGSAIATCPDRVDQFIMANSTLSRLATSGDGAIGSSSPNRLLYMSTIPPTANFNPIDNHRFFVWQLYGDFVPTNYLTGQPQSEPDEAGLDYWTNQIIGPAHNCNAGVNDNNTCTNSWRDLDSRAFWVSIHGDWFTGSYGLAPYTSPDPIYNTANKRFVRAVYQIYLRREPNDPPDGDFRGFNFWVGDLTDHYGGDPANQDGVLHIIDAFLHSTEYRQRFGGS